MPIDSNDFDIFPLIVEFKPDMSYFCIKELKINRLWKEDYEDSKSIQLYTQEHVQSQSLAAVHYNPENVLKRMNFEVIQEEETEEITSTTESEEPS